MRRGIVPEFNDAHVVFERGLDDAALHAAAAPVHESDFMKAGTSGGLDKFVDHRPDILPRKRVEIELAFDRNTEKVVSHETVRKTLKKTE
jgi:hypothetical protein